MEGVKIVAFACFLWSTQLYTVVCQSCNVEEKVSGKIVAGGYLGNSKICWTIPVPLGHSVHLQMKSMVSEMNCNDDNVRINISGVNDVYKFCKSDDYLNPITALGNVTVTHSVTYNYYSKEFTSFLLEYNIKPIECLSEKNFNCDKNSCVSKDKVCDGVRDCKNGADESGCETNECSAHNTFQCGNNYCIPAKNVCDGVKHCKNGADEVGCDTLQCETESHDSDGQIVVGAFVQRKEECWRIPVKAGHFIHMHFPALHSKHSCSEDYVQINVTGTGDVLKFCTSMSNINNITSYGNVTVTHYVSSSYSKYSSFNLVYSIYPLETTECPVNNSFRCDSNSCIPKEKVCDGVKDCANGADEIGCETVTIPIEGVSEARQKAVSWLKQQRTVAWGWKENTHRAIIALYLASAASFNGTVLEEELMAKQNELRTAVALLRPSLTNSELSMLINALLVTCHNPRQFYGNNLVQRLKHQVEESGNFTHPLAYLTLCNANESWPLRATSDLINVLNSTSGYPFKKDLQAMAITALSCERSRRRHIAETLYEDTIKQFKKLQHHDGSFGNVYTTALITQALISSGQERSRDWSLNATLKYLMKELNASSVDLLATYFVLPILNGKSLMDISYVNCSANPRKHGDDPVSDISDYVGPKMRVQYSLYIGDEKDVVHTISFRAPKGYRASKVMELAEDADSKYKFQWKMTAGKMYVYEIAGVKNDPEAGKFWLLYVSAANSSEPLKHLTNVGYLNMNLEEKRKKYRCKSSYVTSDDIPTWTEYSRNLKNIQPGKAIEFRKDERLNDKVSVFIGDITVLEIDAIINSSNRSLHCAKEFTAIHADIHKAAGPMLLRECNCLGSCELGEAKITGGYDLPAKYVIHTIGPVGLQPDLLRSCYLSCLDLAKEKRMKTIAFPCISTGARGYPNRSAAQVALGTVREFLEKNIAEMDRIIFCLFQPIDVGIYESLMQNYFPI